MLGLTACASWKKNLYNGKGDQVATQPTMLVPQNLNASQMREYYPIPDVVHQRQASVSLAPPDK